MTAFPVSDQDERAPDQAQVHTPDQGWQHDDDQHENHDDDQHGAGPQDHPATDRPASRVTGSKPPSGLDRRAARSFARRVLSLRAELERLGDGDVAVLERLSGERRNVQGNLDELAVVLASGESGADSLTAARDLLAKVAADPMEAVVEATVLAADSPEMFREVFTLTRELGLHDVPRTPSGHEVKAAMALVQALRQADTDDANDRLERLVTLAG